MADIENKTIEQKIDKNEDHIVDYLEIRNFLLEDKNQSENVQELGNYLNNLPDREYNEIRQTLEYIMSDPEIIKIFDGIGQKVGKNEKLSNDELSVLYISAVLFGKGNGFINIGKFDLKLQIEKICNGQLLAYIQKRYNNYNYNPNKGKENNGPYIENLGRQNQYRNPNVPSPFPEKVDKKEQIEREYEGLPQIPPISQRGNKYIHSYCNDIYRRAENNGYLMMAEYESRLRNEFRSHFSISELGYVNDKEFDAYVKYDKMLFAFSKYCEVINKKHEQVIKEAGYHDMDEFAQEMKYFSLFQDLIKEKYPELEVIMKRLEPYWGEMEENKKKYFEGKSDEEIEQAGHNFKEFQEFQNKKNEEYGITDDMIESLNVTPNTKEEAEDYFKNLNTVLVYQNELNEKKGEYGDTIDNYYGYMTGISEIQKKYSESDFDTIKNYSKDLQTRGQSIDFDRCSKYASLIDRTGKYGALGKDLKNIGIIQEVLMDPTNEDFFILDVKNAEIAKRLRQERIDETRGNIKKYAPERYRTFTVLAGFWNGLVDSTIGVGTSLGAMITGLIGGKEHYQSQLQKKERRDNFLKINQSSSQKEAVYDGESLNFKRDNTISTVSGSIAQMLCLIYGGSAISGGISKLGAKAGIKISAEAVGKIGLFSQSFITQVGQSYGEAINSGLEGGGAFAYSMLSASVQSGLELVSPNDVLLGKGTGLGKQLISSICKNEGGIKLVGTYFLKTIGREILEENLQEGLQLAAGNLINDMVNGVRNTGLESDWNPKNFLSTAIITTLTTGITTGFSAGRQGLEMLNSNQLQLMSRIASDQGLYEDVMKVLNNTINGNMEIPNIKIEDLQDLRTTLSQIQSNNTVETNNNQTEDQENNENTEQKGKKKRNKDYFNGQSHEFNVTKNQAIENSQCMDNILENINEGNIRKELDNLKKRISEQYHEATGENLELSDEQLFSILDAHEQDGILGQLTRPQLTRKVKILAETITDPKIRRFLLEAGFCGQEITESTQLHSNVERLQELGIEIPENKREPFNKMKLDFEKLGKLKELGVNIDAINVIGFNQTEFDFEKLGKLKVLGVNIEANNVIRFNQTKFDFEKLGKLREQGIEIDNKNILYLNMLKFENTESIIKFQRLQNLGIEIYNDKVLEFLNPNFEKLGKLKELGVNIEANNIISFNQTEFDFEKLGKLKEFGVNINAYNIIRFNQTEFDFEKLGKLKELGVNIEANNIISFNQTEFDFEKLGKLKELGVNIEANNIISFNQKEFDFEKLGKLKEFGVNINAYNVISFNQKEFDFEKLGKLKELGVNIDRNNVINFNQTEFDFEKLGKLKEFGININEYNIIELNKIDENKLQKVKEIFDEFGIVVGNDFINRRGGVTKKYENIKYLREIKHEINQKGIIVKSLFDVELLLNIVSNRFTNKREYMERRNKFLQENETLSEQKFNELFKDGEDKGKYGIGNIHQKGLGYCYAYTGFELLKKSNFFETLVRTSMRETDNGREVKLPLGDSNGHIIKIKKSEIDSEYSFMDEEEGHQKNVNINSDSSLGFKILEIAFIKEYLINPPSSKVQGIVNKAKNEYETTGDITINGKLLHQLEGGRTTEFMERILGSKIYTHKTDFKSIVPILDYIKYGDIKIDLDLSSNISGKKNVMCKLKDGKTGEIRTEHAYSIERTYIDRETKEKIIVIVNPRDTSKKLEMTLNECSTVFSHAGITTINMNKIFK